MLIGHQRIWDFLQKSAKQNKLAHAYLFVGPAQVGKTTLALEFVKWLLCEKNKSSTSFKVLDKNQNRACGQCKSCLDIAKNQHPDVFVLSPPQFLKGDVLKSKEIGIDEVRALQHQLALCSYGAQYKVAIIEEAAALSSEAANSFLKTLEEPSGQSIIILISSAWQSILPTIISRCQLIKFGLVPEREITAGLEALSKKKTDFKKAVKLTAGQPGRAIKLLTEPDFLAEQEKNLEKLEKLLKSDLAWRFARAQELAQNTPQTQEVLAQWLVWLRDRVLESSGRPDLMIGDSAERPKYQTNQLVRACREIQKTKTILSNTSFNARLALEVLMLKI